MSRSGRNDLVASYDFAAKCAGDGSNVEGMQVFACIPVGMVITHCPVDLYSTGRPCNGFSPVFFALVVVEGWPVASVHEHVTRAAYSVSKTLIGELRRQRRLAGRLLLRLGSIAPSWR